MLFRALAVALLLLPSAQASAQQACPVPQLSDDFNKPTVVANDSRLLAEANRIVNLPDPQRALQIAHVYRDIFSALHPRWYPLDNWHVEPDGDLNYFKSRVGVRVRSAYTAMYAQQISLALLAAYPREAQPLIQRDLRSNNLEELERGIFVARRMTQERFPDFYDQLKNIFLRGGACSDEALAHLFRYVDHRRDPADRSQSRLLELRPVLIAKFQKDPENYAYYLAGLLSVGPAPAELIADLDSNDPTLRARATFALSNNTDPRLAPFVFRMLSDPDPRIRLFGFRMGRSGLQRKGDGYGEIKPALEAMMRDPDWAVQLDVLETFAFTGDPVCAPVLLEVIRKWAAGDPWVPDKDFGQLAILAEAIAHQKFGFGDRNLPARDDPANTRAIGKFSDWVSTQVR